MARILLRGLLYLALSTVLAQVLYYEVLTLPPDRVYSEFGYVEILQSLILLAATVLLAFKARADDGGRQLAVCMALAFAFLLIRENDQILELFLPHGAWKYFAAVPAIVAGWYFWKHRADVGRQVIAWSGTASFGVMLSGFVVLVFSRVFGRSAYWREVMADGYQRTVKNAAEEGIEFLALALLLVAVVEWVAVNPARERS